MEVLAEDYGAVSRLDCQWFVHIFSLTYCPCFVHNPAVDLLRT